MAYLIMGRKRFSFISDRVSNLHRRIPSLLFFKRNKSGTAAVEFAILAPVFLLILMGMIAFGLYLGRGECRPAACGRCHADGAGGYRSPGAVDAGDNLHPEKRGKIFTDRSSQDAGECRQCPVRSEPVHGDDPLQCAKPADLEPDDGAAASRHDHYKGIDNKAWRNLTQGGGIRYAGPGIAFPACAGRQSGDNGGAGIPHISGGGGFQRGHKFAVSGAAPAAEHGGFCRRCRCGLPFRRPMMRYCGNCGRTVLIRC